MSDQPPIEVIYDLADISAGGADVPISASATQLPKLANWLGVQSVEKFSAVVNLRKLAMNRYRYEAGLNCDLTQASVVSLQPVHSHIEEGFSRELHVSRQSRYPVQKSEEVSLDFADDEASEEILSTRYDLAGPLLEELALALDPYPRTPAEVFSPPQGTDTRPESPFAILKKLWDKS